MRSRVTLAIDPALADRARDLAAATPGLTLTTLVERGLWIAVRAEERRRGGAAPRRRVRRLPAGRKRVPVGT